MAGELQFDGKTRSPGARLDPEVRSWIRNVIVPAMVREYLAEQWKGSANRDLLEHVLGPGVLPDHDQFLELRGRDHFSPAKPAAEDLQHPRELHDHPHGHERERLD